MHRVRVGIVLQCMQAMPQQIYLHDGVPTSFEPGIVVQPSGVVHHSCASLPVVDVHPYFTECLDAHQIVVSCLLLASDAAVMGLICGCFNLRLFVVCTVTLQSCASSVSKTSSLMWNVAMAQDTHLVIFEIR